MEKPLGPHRLLDMAQTAAILRHIYLAGPEPETARALPWLQWDEPTRFLFIYRSALRFAFAQWHDWYKTGPAITAEQLHRAAEEMKKIYDPLPSMLSMIYSMQHRGHARALKNIFNLRDRIIGSGVAFTDEILTRPIDEKNDENVCLRFVIEKLPRGQSSFLQGAYEAADALITNLSRVMRDIEYKTGRNITENEFNIVSKALIGYLNRGGYRWRQDNMRDILFQEHGSSTYELTWNAGNLSAARFKRCDDDALMTIKGIREVYEAAGRSKLHTGCPAIHARTDAQNGTIYTALLKDYMAALGRGLAFGQPQSLRAAQKMTL